MYSVEEVAEQLRVSKVTIYAKLKKHDDMVVLKQGKKYVPDELLSLIKSELNLKNNLNNDLKPKDIECNGTQGNSKDRGDLVKLNKDLINSLLNQVAEKDRQIADMQKTIDELVNLNKNSQVLLKQQQDKEIKTFQLEERFHEVDSKLEDLREKMVERQQENSRKKIFDFFRKK